MGLGVEGLEALEVFPPEGLHRRVHIVDAAQKAQHALLEVLLFAYFQHKQQAVDCLCGDVQPHLRIMAQAIGEEARRAVAPQDGVVKVVHVHSYPPIRRLECFQCITANGGCQPLRGKRAMRKPCRFHACVRAHAGRTLAVIVCSACRTVKKPDGSRNPFAPVRQIRLRYCCRESTTA